jgi:hypothetical protein
MTTRESNVDQNSSQIHHKVHSNVNNCCYWLDSSVRGKWVMPLRFYSHDPLLPCHREFCASLWFFFILCSCQGYHPLGNCHGLKVWGPNVHMELNSWTHDDMNNLPNYMLLIMLFFGFRTNSIPATSKSCSSFTFCP